MSNRDLVNRLRGIYNIPVNDGAGLLDGKSMFTRTFDNMPPIMGEAANEIERLEHQLAEKKTFKVVVYDEGADWEEHYYYIDGVEITMISRGEGDDPEVADILFESIADFFNQSVEVENRNSEDDDK